jgi:hypothetical protein
MTRTSDGQRDDPSRRASRRWTLLRAGWIGRLRPGDWIARIRPVGRGAGTSRLLFLDDDPCRAEAFLKDHPQAVWVTTVPDCLARLAEPWDEVHLDHDLGGKIFVDSSDTDCGMEVIRWLCKEARPHLRQARFFVHTHNSTAGLLMVLLMRAGGYKAEFRPFALDLEKLLARNETGPQPGAEPPSAPALRTRLLGSLRSLRGTLAGLATWRTRLRLAGGRGPLSAWAHRRSGERTGSPLAHPPGEAQPNSSPCEP